MIIKKKLPRFIMAGLLMLFTKLVKAAISFPVNMFWKSVLWAVALLSLPFRMLTALQREMLLEQRLQEMQYDLKTLVWDRKELEDHLQAAVRERRIMESMLIELEGEHDKAIARIELLEGEYLEDENLQLKEVQGKAACSYTDHNATKTNKSMNSVDNHVIPYSVAPWISSYKGSGISLQELMINRQVLEGKNKSNTKLFNLLKPGPEPSGSVELFTPSVQDVDTFIGQRRDVALSKTLFSAILSVLVGMVVWEAEDPCMPLVVALFAVVGMSLKSVVQFFISIKNKPASDAVSLLSFNWFIVGTLSYPALPKVTHMLAPLNLSLENRLASCFGISFN